MNEVGKELKRLRLKKGWTQAQLAVYAESSQPTVNQIESGVRNPSTRTLEKLAGALEVEVGDLFPKGQAPLPSPVAAEMEATLLTIRENVEVLERYFDNPPDEATADEAMDRFYDLMPKPLEHLSLMHPDEMRQYIGEVREVFEAQAKINRQLEAWNVAQYSHLHKQHA